MRELLSEELNCVAGGQSFTAGTAIAAPGVAAAAGPAGTAIAAPGVATAISG